ncbi:MAG: hypothetical protein A2Y88_04570 [Chloroflexi bacterium RBG_13_48_10]|nr:MAG: hypothetical protein A2Y88_04570 [Chloroflexi bacterium RBG_13_48_10]
MLTQAFTKHTIPCPFVFSLSATDSTLEQPLYACTLDYGFDFDVEELGRELLAQLPASLVNQSIHHVEAEEFESLYQWFNS